MTTVRALAVIAVSIGALVVGHGVARAQSASTPIMDPNPSFPLPTIGGGGPHALDGRLLFGLAAGLGESGAAMSNTDRSFWGFDTWLGYGLGDRLAILAFGQALNPAGDLRYAFGGGVRVWPLAKVRAMSVEGRVGIDWLTHDRMPSSIGAIGEAVLAIDVVRLPTFGLELRTTLAGASAGGERYAELLAGLGVSFY